MTDPRPPRTRGRVTSVVLSTISLAVMTVLLLWLAGIMATSTGAATMIAVLPVGLFLVTSWLWGILGLVALGLGLTSARPLAPCLLAVLVLVELIVGLVVVQSV